ncbi:MAG: leucyl aminopeptidase [Longimicrobiales bacterium]
MGNTTIKTIHARAPEVETPLLALQVFERAQQLSGSAAEIDQRTGGLLQRVMSGGDFTGKKEECLPLYPPANTMGAERILLVGAGKPADYTLEQLRRSVGATVRQAERLGVTSIALLLDHVKNSSERIGPELAARGAVEAAILASWDLREYKTKRDDAPPPRSLEQVVLVAGSAAEKSEFEEAAGPAAITARSVNLARDLATRPGNVVTPSYLAGAAEEIARKHSMKLTVLDRAQMHKEGMGALLAVAQGTQEEPRFIILEYNRGASGQAPLALIGKGVTFDAGGISIKPAERMEDMKYDMAGAAAVLGAMNGIAELGLETNVVALIPSTENLPSGSAFKPGDVIRSHAGKTIEIVNTDAEGRLLLADALSYAQRFKPAAIIDAATLTGAVVVALGQQAMGLMGTNGELIEEVRSAGQRAGERCWPLPLWDEYRELIDSSIADMKNSGGRAAGTITGGWFLKEFAGEIPWVHLDIAGTAYREEAVPYLRKGATGVPTRLFIEWVRTRAQT